jgi:phage terminase small subunit
MAKKAPTKKENPRHKTFVLEYIKNGGNATKAYMIAFNTNKCTVAAVEGSKLLRKPNISDVIQAYYEKTWAEKEKKISEMFDKLLNVVGADISDYIDKNGDVKVEAFEQMNTYPIAEYTQSISDTAQGQNIKRTIKLKDSLKAISELTKILGMIQDKVEHSGTIEIIPAERPKDNEIE